MMKITLPLIAAVLIVLVVVWPQFKDVREGFRIEIARLKLQTGGQRVSNARYTGTDVRGRPFTVTAEAALQDEGESTLVKLEHPKADITLATGTWVAASAPEGVYGRNDNILRLAGGVNVYHDAGFEIHSPTAMVDMKRGIAEGNDRVEGQGPSGTIVAAGFRVLEAGGRVLFTGPAKLVLRPDAQQARR
jgi:lipopolysaccharide export system protein LptC